MSYSRNYFIRKTVSDDVEYIKGNYNPGDLNKEDIYDVLLVSPVIGKNVLLVSPVTGKDAEWLSWEALEILVEACNELCWDVAECIEEGPGRCGITIRQHLLAECIDEIIKELELADFFCDSDDSDK